LIFRGKFSNPNPKMADPTRATKNLTRPDPGQKNLTHTHHYTRVYVFNWLIDWQLLLRKLIILKMVLPWILSYSHLIIFHNYESKIKRYFFKSSFCTIINPVTEKIIFWNWLIKANPGVKDPRPGIEPQSPTYQQH